MSTRDPHAGGSAVVIGSGFGGLAAAMRLRARGWRVQVLERLPSPGGRARVHEIGGHRFAEQHPSAPRRAEEQAAEP